MKIDKGCEVTMHFTLSLPDGSVADSSRDDDPITFILGEGEMAEGLELALYGLTAGDKQTLTIGPREGFGFHNPEFVHVMPHDKFDPEITLEPGLVIEFTTADEELVPGVLLEVEEESVTVDFNHPLADKEIVFDVEILAVTHPQAAANDE